MRLGCELCLHYLLPAYLRLGLTAIINVYYIVHCGYFCALVFEYTLARVPESRMPSSDRNRTAPIYQRAHTWTHVAAAITKPAIVGCVALTVGCMALQRLRQTSTSADATANQSTTLVGSSVASRHLTQRTFLAVAISIRALAA